MLHNIWFDLQKKFIFPMTTLMESTDCVGLRKTIENITYRSNSATTSAN